MFDISERKKTEEKLLALQKELEALSFKDGLTGIANRRQFDTSLAREWESARHSQRPLSLMLVDVDLSSSTTTSTATCRATPACARSPRR
jgi:PleD family two-component response regulator